MLLCAGRFAALRSPSAAVTLLKPFESAAALATQLGVTAALLCVPTAEQAPYAVARWRARLPRGEPLATCVVPEEPTEEHLAAAAAQLPRGAALVLDFA